MGVEILAPVGGREQLLAAVRCGADAVYLGMKEFNARRNADNFDEEELKAAVAYCHARNVKVHIALNTLLLDSELPAFLSALETVAASGADAVILQDLAAAKLVREACPELELHASTQMAVHNADGARFLENLGFSRVVLARELSLPEIETICRETSLAVEVFIHGAQCMCISGMCYLSSVLGGRSGNRGLCAQPCRLDFRAGTRPYALSLKDMSHLYAIKDLVSVGVSSFKIEGRMKRPEYVAAAVAACRDALAGREVDLQTLQSVFSRSGFTDGYLAGRRSLDMFGYRTRDDVAAASGVLSRLAGSYRAELPRVPVDMRFQMVRGKPVTLQVFDGLRRIICSGAIPQEAYAVSSSREQVQKALSKTGGTPFYLRSLDFDVEDGLMLPISECNRLRREGLKMLLAEREMPVPRYFQPTEIRLADRVPETLTAPVSRSPEIRARAETWDQALTLLRLPYIAVPVAELVRHLPQAVGHFDCLVAEIPVLTFPGTEVSLWKRLETLKQAGLKRVLTCQAGMIRPLMEAGFIVSGGYGLNILNSLALQEYSRLGARDVTLSFELPMRYIHTLQGETARGIIGYGHLPLMQMRACPAQKKAGCAGCTGRPILRDRRGRAFPLLCHGKRYTTLFNPIPLYIADKLPDDVDFVALYFSVESPERCREICRRFLLREPPDFERTNGLYYRTLK